MKRLLSSLVLLSLAAVSTAQSQSNQIDRGIGIRRNDPTRNSPPITNPEPMTLVALAGGAAVAGGLLRRRRQNKA